MLYINWNIQPRYYSFANSTLFATYIFVEAARNKQFREQSKWTREFIVKEEFGISIQLRFDAWDHVSASSVALCHRCKSRGATGAIAPPWIFQDGLNVA